MSLIEQVKDKNYAFKNMVFEGGGVKGIAYGGAVQTLETMGLFAGIKRYAGTSAGAINATLLALGYSVQEMSDLVEDTPFDSFADDSAGFLRDAKRVWTNYGWHKGKAFEKWIGERIREKTGNSETTFRQLAQLVERGEGGFRHLYVVGTNLSTQQPEVYCSESTEAKNAEFLDMKIKKAVRTSMSIPLYFQAVENKEGEVLVDGGVTYNYPIDLFDHTDYVETANNGEPVDYNRSAGFVFNHETIGFRLDDRGEGEQALRAGTTIPHEIDSFGSYAWALVAFMRQMAAKLHLHKNDWNRTVSIDTTGVKTTDFSVTDKQKARLVANGKTAVEKHFDWRVGNVTSQPGLDLPK